MCALTNLSEHFVKTESGNTKAHNHSSRKYLTIIILLQQIQSFGMHGQYQIQCSFFPLYWEQEEIEV